MSDSLFALLGVTVTDFYYSQITSGCAKSIVKSVELGVAYINPKLFI